MIAPKESSDSFTNFMAESDEADSDAAAATALALIGLSLIDAGVWVGSLAVAWKLVITGALVMVLAIVMVP